MKKRLVSGIQPTGNLHIGNFLGSIKNWQILQQNHESFFFMADLHAITIKQQPEELKNAILQTAATYVACGIGGENSVIFQQSSIPAHAELAWILGCNSQIGWLNRMTQFKEKSKNKESASVGLFTYPVLMAADILLYGPEIVPVGNDQTQHVELTRDIALSFNRNFNVDFFKIPEIHINKSAQRIMSLRDGTKKMSKSDESDMTRINLTDSADEIATKIKKAKTDSIPEITLDEENRPEMTNLLKIYANFANLQPMQVVEKFNGKSTANFKTELAELLISSISPISLKINELMQEKSHLEQILSAGAEQAQKIAETRLKEIKKIIGL